MKTLHPEYVIDENKSKKAVLIPFKEWQKILEEIEELEDIRIYDKAKSKKLEFISLDKVVDQIQRRAKN